MNPTFNKKNIEYYLQSYIQYIFIFVPVSQYGRASSKKKGLFPNNFSQ